MVVIIALAGVISLILRPETNSNTAIGQRPTGQTTQSTADPTKTEPPTPESAAGTTTPSPGQQNSDNSLNPSAPSNNIAITSDGFSPASATVAKGASVTWTNKDSAAHALDPADGSDDGPHSPQLQPGESYTYTFGRPGSFTYIDVLNPSLRSTVTVND